MTLIKTTRMAQTPGSSSSSSSSTRSRPNENAGASTAVREHVGSWSIPVQNLVSAPLEEEVVPTFLTVLYSFIERNTLPPAKHIHVLLYLARLPGQPYLHLPASPLTLLDYLSRLHTPANIARLLPLPGNPFRTFDPKESTGEWDARGKVESEALNTIRACEEDGVYDLLWEKARAPMAKTPHVTHGRRKRRRRGDDSEVEEEQEAERKERVVAPDAWGLVEWLIDLWRRDSEGYAAVHPGQPAISPLFLEQLPRNSADLQLDDLTCPLAILRALSTSKAYNEASSIRHHMLQTLLDLILASVQDSNPPFHPDSLALGIIPLLRESPTPFLSAILSVLSSSRHITTVAHVLTVYLEDLGGTRASRADLRRQVARGVSLIDAMRKSKFDTEIGAHDLDPDTHNRWGHLKPPSPGYFVCGLLPLAPASDIEGAADRMEGAKNALMGIMPDLTPSDDALWDWTDELDHDTWIESLKKSMGAEMVDDVVAFVLDYVGSRLGDDASQVDYGKGTDMDSASRASRRVSRADGAADTTNVQGPQLDQTSVTPNNEDRAEGDVYVTPPESTTPTQAIPTTSQKAAANGTPRHESKAEDDHGGGDEVNTLDVADDPEQDSLEKIMSATSHRVLPLGEDEGGM